MKTRQELKSLAREQLRGNWTEPVLMTLIYMALAILVSLVGQIPFIGWVAPLLLSPLLLLGYMQFFLLRARGQFSDYGTLFSLFGQFGVYWPKYFVTSLLVGLRVLLFALPGIILMGVGMFQIMQQQYSYSYSSSGSGLAMFLFFVGVILFYAAAIVVGLRYCFFQLLILDHPEMKASEILKMNADMMDGYKVDFFVLCLSFIGWAMLATLTFCIGYLWLTPYMQLTYIRYYDNLKEVKGFNSPALPE